MQKNLVNKPFFPLQLKVVCSYEGKPFYKDWVRTFSHEQSRCSILLEKRMMTISDNFLCLMVKRCARFFLFIIQNFFTSSSNIYILYKLIKWKPFSFLYSDLIQLTQLEELHVEVVLGISFCAKTFETYV